jgi:hypothetical protein
MIVTGFAREGFLKNITDASGIACRKFEGRWVMTIYRSPMEKILEQQEENTVITSPKEPTRTFFRKIAYIFACWNDKMRKLISRSQG